MNHIEIIGPPGSGKSTLQQELTKSDNIFGNNERYKCVLKASPIIGTINNIIINSNIERKIADLYWKFVLYNKCVSQFKNRFPAIDNLCERAGHLDERSHYPKMYYRAGAEFICFQNHSDKTYVLDEGLPQLTPEILFVDQELGEQFLQLLPVPDVVVQVDCPAEECLRRQYARNKSVASSLRHEKSEDAIGRLDLYRTQFQTTADSLSLRGSHVVQMNSYKKDVNECLAEIQSIINP